MNLRVHRPHRMATTCSTRSITTTSVSTTVCIGATRARWPWAWTGHFRRR